MSRSKEKNTLSLWAQRVVRNFSFDLRFVFSSLPNYSLRRRISYIKSKYRAILSESDRIDYLGTPIAYDNRFTPALLQTYPGEIRSLLRHLPQGSVKTVLDVGANIGQFAFTLKKFLPDVEIFSFEPNSDIYPLLKENATRFSKWNCFPVGLGLKAQRSAFFFVPEKSAQGSLFRENSTRHLTKTDVKAIEVELCKLDVVTLSKLGIPPAIDLLKIDVEGAEREVLSSLGDLKWKYLWIEISDNRSGAFSLENLIHTVEKIWGKKARLLFQAASSGTRNVLLT
jgi:FkbM family methyltransferase